MANVDMEFAELLFKILARQTGQISRVDFKPQKPAFRNIPVLQPLERATPESQGVSSDHIREYLDALRSDAMANPHHVMILRHGKVITECSFAPYKEGVWHITHSMCKSMTGMAVGIAVKEGLLSVDDKLRDLFPEYLNIRTPLRQRDITIGNLLDMTSNVEFMESGAISGNEWKKSFMSAGVKCEPGTKWEYNSMNSYMLSAAIQQKTGKTMFEYLKEKLFEPMGIEEIFWESSPEGVTKGGWGMFIKPEDACKLGQLYLNDGVWNGKQLIDPEWIKLSTSVQADNGKYGYGYQIWMEEKPGGYSYNGLFGQNVVIYPEDDMVVMINCGNNEITQTGSMTEIMRRYWGIGYHPVEVLPEDREAQKRLADTIQRYEHHVIKPKESSEFGKVSNSINEKRTEWIRALAGRTYDMENARIGLFPLICQVMHYNFTDGIRRIRFEEVDGELMVLFYEGDEIHHIRVGFDEPRESEILLHGEAYLTGSFGRFTQDENDHLVLVLEIAFLEEACTRRFVISFMGDHLSLKASEVPGENVITDAIAYAGDNPMLYKMPVVKDIIKNGGLDFLNASVESAAAPKDKGHLVH